MFWEKLLQNNSKNVLICFQHLPHMKPNLKFPLNVDLTIKSVDLFTVVFRNSVINLWCVSGASKTKPWGMEIKICLPRKKC